MTLYFYDTEFVEDGTTIDLISIAFVSEDGRELYRHVDGYDVEKAQAHEFVSTNVLPHLENVPRTPRAQVAAEIAEFIRPSRIPVQLWGFFPAYDHVALAQLYGTMMDLPENVPMRTNCVAQLAQSYGYRNIPVPNENAHDALVDARWTRQAYRWLTSGGVQ